MRRILLSLVTIALVMVVGVYSTKAYFSDVHAFTGTISTGDVAIGIDKEEKSNFQLNDLKPGYTDYINFTVTNEGSNPVNVIKRLHITSDDPENLAAVIKYDEEVELYKGSQLVWHQMLYNLNQTVAGVNNTDMFLGMLPEGQDWSMKVKQSYHMDELAGNQYQKQTIGFDMTVTGEQLKGTVQLLPKTGDPNWQLVYGGASATLTYGVMDSKFNYTFVGTTPVAGTNYSLVMFEESWSTPSGSGWPRPVLILGSGTSSGGGNITINGSVDTGDMLNAKIWLVKTTDLVGTTLSGFTQASYLFETGLIDYYKTP